MTERTKNILRWIAVPFVAIIACPLGYLIGQILARLTGSTVGIEAIYTITSFSSNLFAGMCFVLPASCVAPSYNKQTSIVLATIAYCIAIGSIVLIMKGYGENTFSFWASLVLFLLGATFGSFCAHNEDTI